MIYQSFFWILYGAPLLILLYTGGSPVIDGIFPPQGARMSPSELSHLWFWVNVYAAAVVVLHYVGQVFIGIQERATFTDRGQKRKYLLIVMFGIKPFILLYGPLGLLAFISEALLRLFWWRKVRCRERHGGC